MEINSKVELTKKFLSVQNSFFWRKKKEVQTVTESLGEPFPLKNCRNKLVLTTFQSRKFQLHDISHNFWTFFFFKDSLLTFLLVEEKLLSNLNSRIFKFYIIISPWFLAFLPFELTVKPWVFFLLVLFYMLNYFDIMIWI